MLGGLRVNLTPLDKIMDCANAALWTIPNFELWNINNFVVNSSLFTSKSELFENITHTHQLGSG